MPARVLRSFAPRPQRRLLPALAILVALGAAPPAGAAAPDAAQRRFADALIEALRAKDPASLRSLSHPAVLACETPATRAYFETGRREDLMTGAFLTGEFTIESVTPVRRKTAEAGAAPLGLLPADGFSYPVAPSQQIQIDAKTRDGQTLYLVRLIADDHGRWREVQPCPNARGLKFVAEQQVKGAQQRAAGRRRLAAAPAPLRAELVRLVADGRWMQALDRYRQATGAGLQDGAEVIAALRGDEPAGPPASATPRPPRRDLALAQGAP